MWTQAFYSYSVFFYNQEERRHYQERWGKTIENQKELDMEAALVTQLAELLPCACEIKGSSLAHSPHTRSLIFPDTLDGSLS